MKENISELKQKIKPEQTKPVLGDLEELHRRNFLSPLTKHQTILHQYIENTTFSKLLAEVSPNKK